jgi:hypothetical protein
MISTEEVYQLQKKYYQPKHLLTAPFEMNDTRNSAIPPSPIALREDGSRASFRNVFEENTLNDG